MNPELLEIYNALKELYGPYPQVMVLLGKEYNELTTDGDQVDEYSIVVCDDPDDKYCVEGILHLDGAFGIWIEKDVPLYQWWPYPEKPVIGKENIINHIKQFHLPK